MSNDLYIFRGDCFILRRERIFDGLCEPKTVMRGLFGIMSERLCDADNELSKIKGAGRSIGTVNGLVVGK